MGWVSPNELVGRAKAEMLGGREVESEEDAVLVLNAVALNVHHEVAASATWLVVQLFPELQWPRITREFVSQLAAFQHRDKN